MTTDASSPVATLLLATMVVVSLAGLMLAPKWVVRSLLRPYWLFRRHEYLTLLTSGFFHASLAHLFFNAFTFWAFGFQLEGAIGSTRFLWLYFLGLLASDLGTYFAHRHDPGYQSLGASGAILAVMFASIIYFPKSSIFILPIPIPIPAPLFALGFLVYTYLAAHKPRAGVNHDAHLSGALSGIAFVAVTDPQAIRQALHAFI